MRVLLSIVVVAATVTFRSFTAAAENPPPPWEISLGTDIGVPSGFVKVGEHDGPSTLLHLHGDLGIDEFATLRAGAAYHLTPHDTFYARFDYTFLYGGTTLDHDVDFNGATLAGGTHLDTRPFFARGVGFYEHELFWLDDGFQFWVGVGLTYTYLHFILHGTLAPTTTGSETKEDFYAQELPVPLGLLHVEYPFTDRLTAVGWADGGFLPPVDSLRTEGGQVTLSQGNADVFLGLRYLVTDAFRVDGGYSFTYFQQHERSGEDNNEILFLGNGVGLTFTYRF